MNILNELSLPCGCCIGCKMDRSRQWAMRCYHESKLHESNCFITLTYNKDHLPDGNTLEYRDFQLFMKRLRKRTPKKIRFFMCGEYGEKGDRPHFHACIFGYDFNDRIHFKTNPSGAKIYTSKKLDSLWIDKNDNSMGFCTVGNVDFNSAAYVARYIVKKQGGRDAKEHYQSIDRETGEVFQREPEFIHMSLKPGIGYGFYLKYKDDLFNHDICVIEGKEMKPPKYYYKKLKLDMDSRYDRIQFEREIRSRRLAEDNTPERLEVKEKVMKARMQFLKRDII